MRWSILFAVVATLSATSASAQLPYNESPFRTEVTINGVGYRLWVDQEAINPDARHGRSPWGDMQQFCRHFCFRCAPLAWGESQTNRALNAIETKDFNYVPLDSTTFIPLNIQVAAGTLPNPHPTYRQSYRDSLVVYLRDGRRLVSVPPMAIPQPALNFRMKTQASIQTCLLLKRQLEGITIFTEPELRKLWAVAAERYADKPWANISLVALGNQGRPFIPRDVVKMEVIWQGQHIPLTRNQLAAYTR